VSGIREALTALAGEMPELLGKKGAPATGAVNPPKSGDTPTETDAERYARVRGGGAGYKSWLERGSVEFDPTTNIKQRKN